MQIKEIIIVEGRDDTAAVKRAVSGQTIETHGFGIKQETWALIEKAYRQAGIVIFTDPDYAGEQIRKKLTEKFPKAKQAYLSREDAVKSGDIGIEHAAPEDIIAALDCARCLREEESRVFTMSDMREYGLAGRLQSAEKRDKLGKALGIGYGNSKSFLNKLNRYGITREEFLKHIRSDS